jgi:hypothetical protein
MLSIGLWRWYINVTITIPGIIHCPVFYFTQRFEICILSPSSGGTYSVCSNGHLFPVFEPETETVSTRSHLNMDRQSWSLSIYWVKISRFHDEEGDNAISETLWWVMPKIVIITLINHGHEPVDLVAKYVFISMSITSLLNLKASTNYSFHKKQDNLSSLDSLNIQ